MEDATGSIDDASWRQHQAAFLTEATELHDKLLTQTRYWPYRRTALRMIANFESENEWVSANGDRIDADSCAANELETWQRYRHHGETSLERMISAMEKGSRPLARKWSNRYTQALQGMNDLRYASADCVLATT